jgi:ankyrin repeat protein
MFFIVVSIKFFCVYCYPRSAYVPICVSLFGRSPLAAAIAIGVTKNSAMSDSRKINDVRINCEPLNGDSVLHRFAKNNCYREFAKVSPQNSAIRAITSLIALEADINAQDAHGNTAMHYVVLNSSDRAIDSLAHAYANFNIY